MLLWTFILRASVITSHKSVMSTYRNPDLMQAPRSVTVGSISIAHKALKVQHDLLQVVEIIGKGMQGFRRAAPMQDEVADLGGKAVNVLPVVMICAVVTAAFR